MNYYPNNINSQYDSSCMSNYSEIDQSRTIHAAQSSNRYIYVKQNYQEQIPVPDTEKHSSRILVNPRFRKVVYINPKFRNQDLPPSFHTRNNIHVNPVLFRRTVSVQVQPSGNEQNVHCASDPENVLYRVPTSIPSSTDLCLSNTISYSDSTENNRNSSETDDSNSTNRLPLCRTRRNSVRSRFKIETSTSYQYKTKQTPEKSPIYSSKYKIVRKLPPTLGKQIIKAKHKNMYRFDKRLNKCNSHKKIKNIIVVPRSKKKFVYVSNCSSSSTVTRNVLVKTSNTSINRGGALVYLNGILYKTSPNYLRKASICSKKDNKTLCNPIRKSKYKLVKIVSKNQNYSNKKKNNKTAPDKDKSFRKSRGKNVPPSKLKKSNVPCSIYRRFGRCKGLENGTCIKIHDPKHIVLCTRFLQGACLKTNCPLSHDVSPEKMPTCKYYLEGLCSRDDCQYLHVKMSPKTDICRDFLKGYCEKGNQCNKRHQFLCPDFEKHGKCPKGRCPYPHGNAVRKNLTVLNKFAKKCSNNIKLDDNQIDEKVTKTKQVGDDRLVANKTEKATSSGTRYYKDEPKINSENKDVKEILPVRPRLGELPSYIPLKVKGELP